MLVSGIKRISQIIPSPYITKRRNLANDVDKRLWDISSYRYLMPIQTRFNDNDIYSHINYAMYFNYFSVITRAVTAMPNMDFDKKYVHVTAKIECIYKKQMCFPDTLLAGAVYSHLGKSSTRIHVALFNPIKECDPCKDIGLDLRGSYANTLNMEKVKEMYESDAAILSTATLVLLDSKSKKPVLEMPKMLLEHYKKLTL